MSNPPDAAPLSGAELIPLLNDAAERCADYLAEKPAALFHIPVDERRDVDCLLRTAAATIATLTADKAALEEAKNFLGHKCGDLALELGKERASATTAEASLAVVVEKATRVQRNARYIHGDREYIIESSDMRGLDAALASIPTAAQDLLELAETDARAIAMYKTQVAALLANQRTPGTVEVCRDHRFKGCLQLDNDGDTRPCIRETCPIKRTASKET